MCVVYFMHLHVYIIYELFRNRFLIRTQCIVYIKTLGRHEQGWLSSAQTEIRRRNTFYKILYYIIIGDRLERDHLKVYVWYSNRRENLGCIHIILFIIILWHRSWENVNYFRCAVFKTALVLFLPKNSMRQDSSLGDRWDKAA